MHETTSRGLLLKAFAVIVVMLTSCFVPTIAAATDAELAAIRARIEGVYALEEWHTESGVFRPPQVEGRSSLLNGTIIVILHNRINDASQTTIASYGTYVLTQSEFAYRYVEPSVFAIKPDAITVSHKLPWEGMRTFDVMREGENVRLKSRTGPQEFFFTPLDQTYSDAGGGTFVGKRVWRRIIVE
jgi:hypothetical protein